MKVLYPEISVKLIGEDGNAFAILGRTRQAMREFGVPSDVVDEYVKQATAGDYGNLLRVTCAWVDTY